MDRLDISRLKKNRPVFMNLGLVISLSMTILAFSWTTDVPITEDLVTTSVFDDDPEIIRTAPQPPKALPPPPSLDLSQKIEEKTVEFIPEPEPEPEVVDTKIEVKQPIAPQPLPIRPIVKPSPPPTPAPEPQAPEVETIFDVVEEMPRFPGCEEVGKSKKDKAKCAENRLLHFLSKQLRYPALAMQNNISGTVLISFVVDKAGEVTDIQIVRDPGGGLGKEALRVVRKMPNWIPGKQRGKEVKVRYRLPVRFHLK
ncbi:MAG: energy transducer TonB [Bacteroidota bacterium]